MRYIFLFLLMYVFVILQTSFLPHFFLWGVAPNAVIVLVFLLNALEPPQSFQGLFAAIAAGLFFDVFSQRPFGFFVLIFFVAAFLVKMLKRTYVRVPVG